MTTATAALHGCEPAVRYAASVTTAEDNTRAAQRLKSECDPLVREAVQSHIKLSDDLVDYATATSDNLSEVSYSIVRTSLVAIGAGLLATIAIALWIGLQGLSKPINRLNATMAAYAQNDLASEPPGVKRGDEVGAMARTLAVFKANALDVNRMRSEQETLKQRAADERRQIMADLATRFEQSAGSVVSSVSTKAAALQATAQRQYGSRGSRRACRLGQ
jgi:methyl-accepting chemotaxis protein